MEELTAILDQMKKLRARLLAVSEAFPEQRWLETPAGGGWSASEVFVHLGMVEAVVVGKAGEMMRTPPKPTPFLKRLHAPVSVTGLRFRRVISPIPLDPKLISEKPISIDRLAARRRETIEFIESTRGKNMSAYRFPHPFIGSLNLYDWFRFLGYHELRHAKQLREIVEKFQR
ncbi:MAG: DinB family protein [Candidatus Acidiferrales bacterium]